jgi:coproporphyrinogen III oxidase-like Fe-S oxidoreductase
MTLAIDTLNKMTRSLTAIRDHVYCTRSIGGPSAKLDLIYVIANETLNECEPEIAEFKASLSADFS